jgi:hypothetical protein
VGLHHEVGHAVDHRLGAASDVLRRDQAGWATYADAWSLLEALGGLDGLPQAHRNALEFGLNLVRIGNQPNIAEGLRAALQMDGHAADLPATIKQIQEHPVGRACLELGGTEPLESWASHRGRRFCTNTYYEKFMSVPDKTYAELQNQSARAHYYESEWFAECYVEYYDPGSRAALPRYLRDFFANVVDKMT